MHTCILHVYVSTDFIVCVCVCVCACMYGYTCIQTCHTRRSEDISFCGNFLMPSQTALRKGNWGSIIHERNPEPVKETYTGM